MNLFLPLLIGLIPLFTLSACTPNTSSPNTSNASIDLPALDYDTTTPVSLTDTTNWSRFSFPRFSIDLPRNWQVTANNANFTEVDISTVPGSDPNSPDMSLTIAATDQVPDTWDITIASYQASYHQTEQDITYWIKATTGQIFTFTFTGANSNPDFISTALKTITLRSRTKI